MKKLLSRQQTRISSLLLLIGLLNACALDGGARNGHSYSATISRAAPNQITAQPAQAAVPHILPLHDTPNVRVVEAHQPVASQVNLPPLPPLPALPPRPIPPTPVKTKSIAVSGSNPFAAIQSANRAARRTPNPDNYHNAMMRYTFEEGALYEVFTAPLRLTSIQLQQGEVITGKPAAGDTVRWIVGVNQGQSEAAPHILVKPVQAGLRTSMVVNTNKRTYLLTLSSHPQTWMPAVRWEYPQDDYQRQLAAYNAAKSKREAEIQRRQAMRQQLLAQQQERMTQLREQQRLAAKAVDVNNLNFSYAIQSPRFSKPAWTPLQVFDDGRKTFIRFPQARRHTEAPALFVLSPQGELQLVNYRVQNDFYVVDRLFQAAELRVGQQHPRIVRILRQG